MTGWRTILNLICLVGASSINYVTSAHCQEFSRRYGSLHNAAEPVEADYFRCYRAPIQSQGKEYCVQYCAQSIPSSDPIIVCAQQLDLINCSDLPPEDPVEIGAANCTMQQTRRSSSCRVLCTGVGEASEDLYCAGECIPGAT